MEFRTGDLVRCTTDQYASIRRNAVRCVLAVNGADNLITLRNDHSPVGHSAYRAHNFELVKRATGESNEMKEKIMLHIAVLIPREGMLYSEMASEVVEGRTVMMADASQSALKERLRARIEKNPDERWLILSGNTIAETACPPVRFRSV